MKIFIIIASVVGIIFAVFILNSPDSELKNSDVLSTKGLHWHSNLEIFVKGEKIEIPENIGLVGRHNPIHTHTGDSDQGVIHMEFDGLVRREDIKLGIFFNNWNKDIRSFGQDLKMTVNGVENFELENYEIKDDDKIKLQYE